MQVLSLHTYIHHWMEWCEIIKIKLYNIHYGYLYQLLRYKTFTFLKRLLKFFTACTGIIIWCSLTYLACMVCQIIDFNKSTLLHIILTTFMHGLSHHMISLVVSTIHSTTVLEDLEIQVHSSPTAFMFSLSKKWGQETPQHRRTVLTLFHPVVQGCFQPISVINIGIRSPMMMSSKASYPNFYTSIVKSHMSVILPPLLKNIATACRFCESPISHMIHKVSLYLPKDYPI